jgi:hypothetical protein
MVSHPLCVFTSFETASLGRSDAANPRRVQVGPGVHYRCGNG